MEGMVLSQGNRVLDQSTPYPVPVTLYLSRKKIVRRVTEIRSRP